ncbi:uncharacterized protein Z520_00171 [Fonsecaea multimorphosa CBS 102226]|uniref:Uncharacterized protein n=1 Tax=Fonsecaea multimorphosa CBS 102226 TaxID=1442371 RepID=A0A0D2KJ34_9EURO|nr:uncharacterized protein Z520_00171 [Fonsecaea multimorphosa CBS 102226]KIY03480.1 hypothetical protein Z520_00171 [Fonsecaea multimorphosa CBS 102226]
MSARFVTDPDGLVFHALIGTASRLQAYALRNLLYRHLTTQTFIGVSFALAGYGMFELAFHLPYYAWRDAEAQIEDPRRDFNGRPMRQSHDVSFLNWQNDGQRSFIYQAQNSCVVAGTDIWRWVGYCFVESYFDRDNEARETVMAHIKDGQEGGISLDPCTYGRYSLEDNIKDPREWFLLVFQCRLYQIQGEWRQVVNKVVQSVRDYEVPVRYNLKGGTRFGP